MSTSSLLRAGLALILTLPQLACFSTSFSVSSVDDSKAFARLQTFQEADGTEVTLELRRTKAGVPTVQRTETRTRNVGYLGAYTEELDARLAESLGIDPEQGVMITSAPDEFPAGRDGVRAGDVLLELGGRSVNQSNLVEVVRSFAPGTRVEARLVHPITEQVDDGVLTRLDRRSVDVTLGTKPLTESSSSTVTLETSKFVRSLTGLHAAALPADLSAELLERETGTLLVSAVDVGSPAYLAGLRTGDRIETIDGQPVEGLDQLRSAVLSRADARGLDVGTVESVDRLFEISSSAAPELVVDGPLGPYRCRLEVRDDLGERSKIDIPILFERESTISRTEWSFLDFIFQFGANYEGRYLTSATREPAKHTEYSMLPFGFFEFERNPYFRRYRLFWLINWSSKG